MLPYPRQTEKETTIADAQSSLGKTPEERAAIFTDLQCTGEAIWAHLPLEERERRKRIARQLDPRPTPWWKHFRKELWPADHAAPE
jgi:hypothetical protein